tara:strand:+ start:1351 stop:1497 length:147 start_codon:yes stop_codon:yes gene_type:complete
MELIMSLLKNILIVGLFLSVFVAVSPAFAEITNENKKLRLDKTIWLKA